MSEGAVFWRGGGFGRGLCQAAAASKQNTPPPTITTHLLPLSNHQPTTNNANTSVARELADCPEFYYPHTLDFRGRAYPMHPLLNHLGDDACRGLLTFAHPKPLGPHGLDWLFVHFANLWGQGEDKRSFDGRRRFTRAHLPQVLAAAQDPLANAWWQGAEKPWQALACCFEIAAALAVSCGGGEFGGCAVRAVRD